ncbi:unnamed protein product [Victoria cruziana]
MYIGMFVYGEVKSVDAAAAAAAFEEHRHRSSSKGEPMRSLRRSSSNWLWRFEGPEGGTCTPFGKRSNVVEPSTLRGRSGVPSTSARPPAMLVPLIPHPAAMQSRARSKSRRRRRRKRRCFSRIDARRIPERSKGRCMLVDPFPEGMYSASPFLRFYNVDGEENCGVAFAFGSTYDRGKVRRSRTKEIGKRGVIF